MGLLCARYSNYLFANFNCMRPEIIEWCGHAYENWGFYCYFLSFLIFRPFPKSCACCGYCIWLSLFAFFVSDFYVILCRHSNIIASAIARYFFAFLSLSKNISALALTLPMLIFGFRKCLLLCVSINFQIALSCSSISPARILHFS